MRVVDMARREINAKTDIAFEYEEKREKAGTRPMPDWTLHDLRRTMVTLMNERLGIAPHVVEACVNHISGGAKAGFTTRRCILPNGGRP